VNLLITNCKPEKQLLWVNHMELLTVPCGSELHTEGTAGLHGSSGYVNAP